MSIPIYHITPIHNLSSMLRSDRLLCKRLLQQQRVSYQDISYGDIQNQRARIQVPCGRGGTLHDYVPFYFAPRSPMLYTINRGNVPGYSEGQTPILHLVTDVATIEACGDDFVFTDGHAIINYSNFFDDLAALEEIDWEVMEAQYWGNTGDDPDRKRRRQAEFLVHEFVDWLVINEIGVINAQIQQQVENILEAMGKTTPVKVHRDWYY